MLCRRQEGLGKCMSQTASFDSKAFSAFEYAGWQQVADKYTSAFAALTLQAAEALLDAAHVRAGMDVLDVASGPGDLAALAVRWGAHGVGVDFSEAMLAIAHQRHPSISFQQGDAEALSFPDNCFDAVVINFGLLHFGNPDQALREAQRVLRPGARLSFTVWAPPEEARGFGIILEALADCGNWQVPLPVAPDMFYLSNAEECSRALLEAGFSSPTITRLPLLWELPSADFLFHAMSTGTVRTGRVLQAQTAEALAAMRRFVTSATRRYAENGKTIKIPMSAVLASALKPPAPDSPGCP